MSSECDRKVWSWYSWYKNVSSMLYTLLLQAVIIMDTFLITRGYVVIYEPFTDIIHINLLPNMENMYGRRD